MENQEASAATGSTDGGGQGQQDPGGSALAALPGVLSGAAGKITPIVEMLSALGLTAAAKPLEALAETLLNSGTIVQSIVDAVAENKENGAVGQALGGASALLEGLTPDGGDGTSFIEKAESTVSRLSDIWNNYYKNLREENGKLNTEKLAGLALEVGETILGAKKMAKVRKALAIGNVVRSTAESVMVAAKSAPFPANLIPIAKAVATGASQLAAVKGQAHAGLSKVPSTGTYLLEQGERVVGSRLNADLSTFLNAQRSDDGVPVGSAYSRSSHVTNSPSINLTINGDASEDAVSSNRNALEGMIRNIFADYAMEAPFA